ncbi:hypothetical protein F441_13308 [Phytophthora nicotianae CJ01A1]|uniref:BZIP domain-containing protein n=2 Tax=Phytophthora nicotianae TaxID=4792 RepID=W2WKS3_PHYNI|nr:hypothetical protein L915_13058 [Phytophthora nicotianae]ETP11165.1 hypothetical protein F441_13308 [Phytophthora nicotianae CJ01A1]
MAFTLLSGEMDDLPELLEIALTSPLFKTTSLIDSCQDIDDSLIPTLWSSLPPPVAQDVDDMNRSNGKSSSSLGSKKRRRQETERNRQRRYRQRLRVERKRLENEVENLSRQLDHLKEGIVQKQAWGSAPVRLCSLSEIMREKEKRLISESENQRLQTAATMQATYIKHLSKLVGGASLNVDEDQVPIYEPFS